MLEWTGLSCVERITQRIRQCLIFLAQLWIQMNAVKTLYSVHCALYICWTVTTWDKAPLFFCVPQVDLQKETLINFLSLEVGPILASSTLYCRVNKRLLPNEGREGGSGKNGQWEVKILDRKRGSRLLPYSPALELGGTPLPFFHSQRDLLNLHSYMGQTHSTVNKTHTWEVLIFTFQTPDYGCAHKNPGS